MMSLVVKKLKEYDNSIGISVTPMSIITLLASLTSLIKINKNYLVMLNITHDIYREVEMLIDTQIELLQSLEVITENIN